MSKTRGSFSTSEKLSIINEADQFGVSATLSKHNLYSNFRVSRTFKHRCNNELFRQYDFRGQ